MMENSVSMVIVSIVLQREAFTLRGHIPYHTQVYVLFRSGALCTQVIHHTRSDSQVAYQLEREAGYNDRL